MKQHQSKLFEIKISSKNAINMDGVGSEAIEKIHQHQKALTYMIHFYYMSYILLFLTSIQSNSKFNNILG